MERAEFLDALYVDLRRQLDDYLVLRAELDQLQLEKRYRERLVAASREFFRKCGVHEAVNVRPLVTDQE